jgi:hypothetical protein
VLMLLRNLFLCTFDACVLFLVYFTLLFSPSEVKIRYSSESANVFERFNGSVFSYATKKTKVKPLVIQHLITSKVTGALIS